GAVRRRGRGRPRLRPKRIVGDKAYSSLANRRYLRRRGIRVTIPRRSNERRRGAFDKAKYRLRNVIERLIGLMKHNRRLATRYEKRADFYQAMWTIGAVVCWI